MKVDTSRTRLKRKAVSGILAAVIFFAMLFTTGMGLVLYTFSSYNNYDKANASAIEAAQAKVSESLLLRSCDSTTNQLPGISPYKGWACAGSAVGIWVQDTGGASVTVVALWIEDSTKGSVSLGPVALSTPYTFNPGTAQIINTTSASIIGTADTYAIALVTQVGNEFVATYPPPYLANANPSITTTLSSTVIGSGGSVYDTAILSGVTSNAGGSVTYSYFNAGTCSGAPNTVSIVAVSSGAVPPSSSHTFASTGSYSWHAIYSGDANNAAAVSPCEPLDVTTNPGVTITTTLSAFVIPTGASVYDTASLSGVTATAGGTVTYNLFSSGFCSGPSSVISTVSVTNGVVPNSASHTFASQGTYYWEAVYSGDANNNGATSSCEPLNVLTVAPSVTITTTLSSIFIAPGQSVYDTSTLSGVTATAGGTVTYKYYSNGICTTGSTTVSVVTVTNGVAPSSASHTFPLNGSYSWQAVYSGDANNPGANSPCEPLTVSSNSCVPTPTNICFSSVSQGLGSVVIDFNSFRWYNYGSCGAGKQNTGGSIDSNNLVAPANVCTLNPTKVTSGSLAYTISNAAWSPSGANHVFSVNVTNADPQHRLMTLDGWTQLWFSSFNLGSGGGRANSESYGMVLVNNVNGVPTAPLTTQATTATITIPYDKTVTLFFSVNIGGDPNNYGSGNVSPIFMLFHGTLSGQSWAENFPLTATYWLA
jgi:hypothetical protein